MKRLGIIVFMALVLTVGGVYATFHYAQHDATPASATLTPHIEDAVLTTAKGTITITKNDFAITVNDRDDNLTTKYTTTGETKVKFTPAPQGADADVVANGIKLKLVIEFEGPNKYNGTDIFTLKSAYTATPGGVVLNNGNKVLTTEITVNLADYIDVSVISLPTYAEYTAYKAQFDVTKIKITISETT